MAVFDKRGLSTFSPPSAFVYRFENGDRTTHDNGRFRELRFSKPEVSLAAGLAVV
jgi:hypothetical protein